MAKRNQNFGIKNLFFSLIFVVATVSIVIFQQDLQDWWRLRGYNPPQNIESIADSSGFNSQGKRLFYLGLPSVEDSPQFNEHCETSDDASEVTLVLGCFTGDDRIYIYNVTDNRLQGIQQVTAAHEMLHLAYSRLSESEKANVDQMLIRQFNEVTDQRIKDLIEHYRQTNPSELLNEMHSIFATELLELSEPLEVYYKQYFEDRKTAVAHAMKYEEQFTNVTNQIKDIDNQLEDLNSQITNFDQQISNLDSEISKLGNELKSLRNDPDVDVQDYNNKVDKYNGLLNQRQSLVDQYNSIVNKYNGLVSKKQQLAENYADLVESTNSRKSESLEQKSTQ